MTDDPATTRWARSAIGGLVGASAWVSAGTLAALHPTSGARVATLPGISWLAAAVVVAAAAGAGATVRRRSLAPLALLALLWLPWLPVRVPAAFLMWEGPLEALVWTAGDRRRAVARGAMAGRGPSGRVGVAAARAVSGRPGRRAGLRGSVRVGAAARPRR